MREYFAAPSRFFSLELHGVRDFLRQCERVHEFEILFALEQRPLTLIGRVNARDFHLFATPVINLYRRHCSPVLLTGERTEHQLVVDRLNTSLYEIHSVKQVKGMLPDGNPVIFSSLQADVHYDCEREPAGYTLHRRREPSPSKYNNPHLPNEDTFIAISPGKAASTSMTSRRSASRRWSANGIWCLRTCSNRIFSWKRRCRSTRWRSSAIRATLLQCPTSARRGKRSRCWPPTAPCAP